MPLSNILYSHRHLCLYLFSTHSINKAQGQTLTRVGVFLEQPCFSHGQLYVAASRIGLPSHIRFAVQLNENGEYRTANIVYKEALT